MKLFKLGLAAVAALFAVSVAHADGTDPTLVGGGGIGSPPCVVDGVSFQAVADSGGNLTMANGACDNTPPASPVTSFSAELLSSSAPGGVTPELDGLLAPFQSGGPLASLDPLGTILGINLQSLDWTVATTSSGQCPVSDGVITCVFSQSAAAAADLAAVESFCGVIFSSQECTDLKNAINGLNGSTDPALCSDPIVYVFVGIIQGCDITLETVAGGGTFTPFAQVDTVTDGATPAALPEPSTLALLLIGLAGLPLLRRRLSRRGAVTLA